MNWGSKVFCTTSMRPSLSLFKKNVYILINFSSVALWCIRLGVFFYISFPLFIFLSFKNILQFEIAKKMSGSLIQNFRLQVFFMNQFPPGPWVSHLGPFRIVQKFAEIFTTWTLLLLPVSTAPAISCLHLLSSFVSDFIDSMALVFYLINNIGDN